MGRQRKAQLARKIADMRTALCIVDDVGAAPVAYPIYRLTPGAFRELVRMACMYADAHSSSSSSATEKSYGSWLTTHTTRHVCHVPGHDVDATEVQTVRSSDGVEYMVSGELAIVTRACHSWTLSHPRLEKERRGQHEEKSEVVKRRAHVEDPLPSLPPLRPSRQSSTPVSCFFLLHISHEKFCSLISPQKKMKD
jgi:hypothetical protein